MAKIPYFISIMFLVVGPTSQIFPQSSQHEHKPHLLETDKSNEIYMCPMHPHIRQNQPGTCSICGMDLVASSIDSSSAESSTESIKISLASRRLAGIETETIKEETVFQSIQAVGTVDFDEGRISTISAYVEGRIEKLFANYIGVKVKKGEHLAIMYSPTLFSAQIEYLQSRKVLGMMRKSELKSSLSTQKILLKNSEQKLKELGLNAVQINNLKRTHKAKSRLEMDSTVTGTVIEKSATEGRYVKAGQIIYKVADLSTVWLLLDMFPEETTYLKYGLKVVAKIQSAPDQEFEGRISFVSPVIDKKTRTVRVRVEIPNLAGILRPGDYASASILLPVAANGKNAKIYDPELADKYISPMHPQETSEEPGKCPICGMDMVPARDFGYTADRNDLEKVVTLPRDAILSVGEGHVVFVETETDRFSIKKVILGPVVENNRVVVLNGVSAGAVVASKGAFLIDSQMQISGMTSLIRVPTGKNQATAKEIRHGQH